MIRCKSFIALVAVLACFCGCSSSGNQKKLKVAATPVPHAQMLEFIKPNLKEQGITLEVVVTNDYNVPNRALAEKEVDANFFQHIPFMDAQIAQFHYPIESLAKIEIEPMGIYSKKIQSLKDLKDNATVGIPNDPTNEGRALLLLQAQGLIKLKRPDDLKATVLSIEKNPKHLKFIEADAAMLPRSLSDLDLVVINTNYALEAKLSPKKDALALESDNSPYVNIIAIRIGDKDRPDLQALQAAMTSEKMKQFILEKYKGAILPAF